MPERSLRVTTHSMKFLSFFAHYTSPLYAFSPITFLREYLPMLLHIQGEVYRADFAIEHGQKEGYFVQPWKECHTELMELLKHQGLYTIQMERESDSLSEYWDLENQLMQRAPTGEVQLHLAMQLRASDVLLLHCVCERISQRTHSPQVWQALRTLEVIRDIEADLRQYSVDVDSGDFNICTAFQQFYGTEARERLTDELARRLHALRGHIECLPDPSRGTFEELIRLYRQERPAIEVPQLVCA